MLGLHINAQSILCLLNRLAKQWRIRQQHVSKKHEGQGSNLTLIQNVQDSMKIQNETQPA